jgi:hypothetical protein
MSSRWRRFEVLLPSLLMAAMSLPEWLADAVLEVVDTSARPVIRAGDSIHRAEPS